MNRKKLGWKPIVLYVCAVLLMIYAIYMMFSIGTYIGQMVEASYISGFVQIAGTFMGYFAQSVSMYIVYALLLAAAGYIIDVLERGVPQKSQSESKTIIHRNKKDDDTVEQQDDTVEQQEDVSDAMNIDDAQ